MRIEKSEALFRVSGYPKGDWTPESISEAIGYWILEQIKNECHQDNGTFIKVIIGPLADT